MRQALSHSARLFVLQSKIATWLKNGSPSESSVIDTRVIQGLRQLPQGDGRDLVADLISVFLTSTQKRFDAMHAALTQKDWESFKIAAHSLCSSTANLGAHSMSELAAKLEDLPATSLPDDAPKLLGELETIFKQVRQELEAEASRGIGGENARTNATVTEKSGRILLVEDSPDDQLLIERSLQTRFDVESAGSEAQALELARGAQYDLVILDVVLPGSSGFEIYGKLRAMDTYRDVPIIFLTGQAALEDKLRGFGLGADDYIVKPFEPMELLARIEGRILRKAPGGPEENVEFSDIRLNVALQRAYLKRAEGEKELDLTPIEFKLLYHFVRHPERTHSRDELLESVWGNKVYVLGRTIDKHVCSLRQKLETGAQYLKTVPGQGYRFSSRA
jgi:two-component system phosphate regulon response regulator PhoB